MTDTPENKYPTFALWWPKAIEYYNNTFREYFGRGPGDYPDIDWAKEAFKRGISPAEWVQELEAEGHFEPIDDGEDDEDLED